MLNWVSGKVEPITSDRFNSGSPVWSADGKSLYFLSDRSLKATVPSPWGPRQPEPQFETAMKELQQKIKADPRPVPPPPPHPDKSFHYQQ